MAMEGCDGSGMVVAYTDSLGAPIGECCNGCPNCIEDYDDMEERTGPVGPKRVTIPSSGFAKPELPQANTLAEAEHLATQNIVRLVVGVLRDLPLDRFIRALDVSENAALVLDPTLLRDAYSSGKLELVRDCAVALRTAQAAIHKAEATYQERVESGLGEVAVPQNRHYVDSAGKAICGAGSTEGVSVWEILGGVVKPVLGDCEDCRDKAPAFLLPEPVQEVVIPDDGKGVVLDTKTGKLSPIPHDEEEEMTDEEVDDLLRDENPGWASNLPMCGKHDSRTGTYCHLRLGHEPPCLDENGARTDGKPL